MAGASPFGKAAAWQAATATPPPPPIAPARPPRPARGRPLVPGPPEGDAQLGQPPPPQWQPPEPKGPPPVPRYAVPQLEHETGLQQPPPPHEQPPEPKGPPPVPPYVARHLEDELEIILLQRQVALHQVYGRWLRGAFADLAARGERRSHLIRCMWAWRSWTATLYAADASVVDRAWSGPRRGVAAGAARADEWWNSQVQAEAAAQRAASSTGRGAEEALWAAGGPWALGWNAAASSSGMWAGATEFAQLRQWAEWTPVGPLPRAEAQGDP